MLGNRFWVTIGSIFEIWVTQKGSKCWVIDSWVKYWVICADLGYPGDVNPKYWVILLIAANQIRSFKIKKKPPRFTTFENRKMADAFVQSLSEFIPVFEGMSIQLAVFR